MLWRNAATVDDTAMVRTLARNGTALALTRAVVLAGAPFPLDVVEQFFVVMAQRSLPHPARVQLMGSLSGAIRG